MAVVDFRSGGFQGARPQRHEHDFPHAHDPDGAYHDQMHDPDWDESHYQAYAEGPPAPVSLLGRLSRLTHYLGALVSVGLIVILAVWGFKLVVRDVSGVPVIRAVQGEARTAPENPGGELSDRTGLAVNSVAAGSQPGQVDQVAIAPAAAGLEPQDVAMGVLGATAQQPSRAVELPPEDDIAPVIATTDQQAAAAAAAAAAQSTIEPDSVEAAIISDVPAAPEAPVNEALTDLSGQQTQDTAINQALAEAQAPVANPVANPAVAQSVRPAARPQRVARASAAAPAAAAAPSAAPAAPAERPPVVADAPAAAPEPAAKPASGSAMAQIGAFDSDKLARGEWNRVAAKFGAVFAGKSMVVQEHATNGRTFWRLRAGGFASKDEARRFCAALIAGGVDCIPATAK